MLKYAFMAIGAALLVAVLFVLLPTARGPRPEPRILDGGTGQPTTSFTIHDAGSQPVPAPSTPDPASPAPAGQAAPPPPSTDDLNAIMQRLRSGGATPAAPDATVSADTATPAAPTPALPNAPPITPPVLPPASPPVSPLAGLPGTPPASPPDVTAAVPPPPRFPTVTAQGTRWRLSRTPSGYTISIDLGSGQVADVHVLPAFANLDPAAINVRVDYLRDTILQNFSRQSGTYSFARDGSVSLER